MAPSQTWISWYTVKHHWSLRCWAIKLRVATQQYPSWRLRLEAKVKAKARQREFSQISELQKSYSKKGLSENYKKLFIPEALVQRSKESQPRTPAWRGTLTELETRIHCSHFPYMDDFKLYVWSEQDIDSLMHTTRIYSREFGMSLGEQIGNRWVIW